MKFLSPVVSAAILSALASSVAFTDAFTTTTTTPSQNNYATTKLFNVPPPASDDVQATKEYADKQAPPASFFQLQQDCLEATTRAINDGKRLLEVEFPPLPANVLELDDVSAYDVAQANLGLAVEFSRGMVQSSKTKINKVSIMFPDEGEKRIAIERYTRLESEQIKEETYTVEEGVTVSALRRTEDGDERLIKVRTKKCIELYKQES